MKTFDINTINDYDTLVDDILDYDEVMETLKQEVKSLFVKHVAHLSNNEMALLKNVSLSSIMSMKKKNYTNAEILTTTKKSGKTNTTIKSAIASLTDEELAQLGLIRA